MLLFSDQAARNVIVLRTVIKNIIVTSSLCSVIAPALIGGCSDVAFPESAREAFLAKTGPENHPNRLGSYYSAGKTLPNSFRATLKSLWKVSQS